MKVKVCYTCVLDWHIQTSESTKTRRFLIKHCKTVLGMGHSPVGRGTHAPPPSAPRSSRFRRSTFVAPQTKCLDPPLPGSPLYRETYSIYSTAVRLHRSLTCRCSGSRIIQVDQVVLRSTSWSSRWQNPPSRWTLFDAVDYVQVRCIQTI